MLMPLAVAAGLTLPALSVQVPEANCPAPSTLNVIAVAQRSIPDRLSLPAKVTVTFVLFHPLAFAAGDGVAVALGGVLSMLTLLMVALAELPALSVTVKVCDCPAPSEAKLKVPVPADSNPDKLSFA